VAARPAEVIDAKGAILNSTWAKLARGGTLVSICVFLVCRAATIPSALTNPSGPFAQPFPASCHHAVGRYQRW